jgi:hypothetical protein
MENSTIDKAMTIIKTHPKEVVVQKFEFKYYRIKRRNSIRRFLTIPRTTSFRFGLQNESNLFRI